LLGLGELPNDLSPVEQAEWAAPGRLAQTFPFAKPWVWETGGTSDEGGRNASRFGTICIGNDGCAMYWHLVVTGPDRGGIWRLCGEGMQPTEPRRDFLHWYEDWLDGVDNWWE
jgi:hypothetical protein